MLDLIKVKIIEIKILYLLSIIIFKTPILGYSLSSGSSQANGNHDTNDGKDLSRTFSDTHNGGDSGNKMEDGPQNAVIKNIKSDILNGFPQRKNDEGGFKVT